MITVRNMLIGLGLFVMLATALVGAQTETFPRYRIIGPSGNIAQTNASGQMMTVAQSSSLPADPSGIAQSSPRFRLVGPSGYIADVNSSGQLLVTGGGLAENNTWTGTNTFSVAPQIPDGSSVTALGLAFSAAPTTGMWRDSGGIHFSVGGSDQFRFTTGFLHAGPSKLSFGSSVAGGSDAALERNSAGILEINSGSTSAYRDLKLRQMFSTPPTAETITAGATITADACGGLKQITAAGAVTTATDHTFTAPAAANNGCVMIVCNTGSNNITLDNNAEFKSAGGADVVVTANDCLTVVSNGSAWYQATALVAN